MTARSAVLKNVRAHLPRLDRPDPIVPYFAAPDDLLATFTSMLVRMGGRLLPGGEVGLERLREDLKTAALVVSRAHEVIGSQVIDQAVGPADLSDVDYGIVRAAFAVAETGSVCLTDHDLGINTLGFLPQHLVVLLDPGEIVATLHSAYSRRPEWHSANYAVLQTGPSATADIEGVLVHGAQGVRSLSVLLCPRSHEAV